MFERPRYPYGLFRCYLAYAYTEYHSAIPRAGVARNRLHCARLPPPAGTFRHGEARTAKTYRGAAAVATAA